MGYRKATIEINEKEYVFELDRTSIKYGEQVIGFAFAGLEHATVTTTLNAWSMGLQKHHPELTIEEREKLFEEYKNINGDIEAVFNFIIEEYAGFLTTTQQDTPKQKVKFS